MTVPPDADPQVEEDTTGLHTLILFLVNQSQAQLNRLYGKPSACLAVFRLLGPLERQIVMNHLWLEGPVPGHIMLTWILKEGKELYEQAMQTLLKLHIMQTNPTQSKYALAASFQKCLRLALTGGGDHTSFGIPCAKEGEGTVNSDFLDQYAADRWESILHFMVSSGSGLNTSRLTKGILYLLDHSGLMAGSKITSSGFQFLLNSPHAQLWILLLQYLKLSETRNLDTIEVVQFLLMLSTMQLGQEYSTENFTATHSAMLEDLQDYGLVYRREQAPNRIYPTRLATTLTSSSPNLTSSNSNVASTASQEFIILETNYRVYAYTDNPLQIAILNLFVNLKGRFANLVTGSVTRESIKRALDNGITANQIISYLVTHAHPQMHRNNPLLPITVQDQIRLWEQEKNRLQGISGYMWKEFNTQSDYEMVAKRARELGVMLWESPTDRKFFVTEDGHLACRDFVKQTAPQGGHSSVTQGLSFR